MEKSYKTILIVLSTLLVLTTSIFTYAYLTQKSDKEDEIPIGLVKVNSHIYFENGSDKTPPQQVETITNHYKENVYHVNISNLNSLYHINKLRIDFNVESSIETYFRVKILDTLTLTRPKSDGTIEELAITSNEPVNYNIASNWYYHNDDWYYYQNKVIKNDNTIPFIIEGLEYDLMQPQYNIQFAIVVEAVQSHLGPNNNWHLETKPWGGEW